MNNLTREIDRPSRPKQAERYRDANLTAARAILENPRRHIPALVDWARRTLAREQNAAASVTGGAA